MKEQGARNIGRRIGIILLALIALIIPGSVTIDASEYDGDRAAWMAYTRANDSCDDWLKVDADCTNYISYCLLSGGLVQHRPIDKLVTYKANNTTDYWFAWKRNRSWSWSTSWTVVTDLREYLNKETWSDSNQKATVYRYLFQNNASGDKHLNEVMKSLKKGDIVQYDENGYRHTVMITKTGNDIKSVCYSAHNSPRQDESMKTFIQRAKDKCSVRGLANFYSIYIIEMRR